MLSSLFVIVTIAAVAFILYVIVNDEYPPEYRHIKRAKGFWE